jgi:DNA-binding response OmpR family regulator
MGEPTGSTPADIEVDVSRGEILHIDDDPEFLEALHVPLLREGYAVTGVAHAADAVRCVNAGLVPDVLIVDFCRGDEVDGDELMLHIRKGLHHCPPIILLTRNPEDAEPPWITDAPVWVARKPMSMALLLASLPGLVQVSRATRQLADSLSMRQATSAQLALIVRRIEMAR